MQAKPKLLNPSDSPSTPEFKTTQEALSPNSTVQAPGLYRVIRRNGELTGFDQNKIAVAVTKAFQAVEGSDKAASEPIQRVVSDITNNVVQTLIRRKPGGGSFYIEEIQDQVELRLVRASHYEVARAYMLYRETRAKIRAQRSQDHAQQATFSPGLRITQAEENCFPPYPVLT